MSDPNSPAPWQPQGQQVPPMPQQAPYDQEAHYDGTQLDPMQAAQSPYGAPSQQATPYEGAYGGQAPAPAQGPYGQAAPYGPTDPMQAAPAAGQQPYDPAAMGGQPGPYGDPYAQQPYAPNGGPVPPQAPGAFPNGPAGPGAPMGPGGKPKGGKSKTGLIIGIVVGVVALIAVLAIVFAVVLPNFSGPTNDDYYQAWNKSTKLSDSYYDTTTKLNKVQTATFQETEFSDKDASDVKADAKSMQDTLTEIEGMKAHRDEEVKSKVDAAKPAVDKYVAYVNTMADTAPALIDAMTTCSALPSSYMGEDSYVTDGTKYADDCSKKLAELEKSNDENISKAAKEQDKTLTTYKDLLKQLSALGNPDDYYKDGVYDKYSAISESMRKVDLYKIDSNLSDAMTKSEKAADPSEAIKDLTEVLSDKMLAR